MSEFARRRRTPFYAGLTRINTLMGVEEKLAIIHITVTAEFVLVFKLWFFIPVAIGLHIFLAHLTRQDPFLRRVYIQYARQADRYDPWPRQTQKRNRRPADCGQGMLC